MATAYFVVISVAVALHSYPSHAVACTTASDSSELKTALDGHTECIYLIPGTTYYISDTMTIDPCDGTADAAGNCISSSDSSVKLTPNFTMGLEVSGGEPAVIDGSHMWDSTSTATVDNFNNSCGGACMEQDTWKTYLDSIVMIDVQSFYALQFESLNQQTVTIDSCTFTELGGSKRVTNSHTAPGGYLWSTFGPAIRAEAFDFASASYIAGSFTVTNSIFSHNSALYGSVYLQMANTQVTFADVNFESNQASSFAGALYIAMHESAPASSWAWEGSTILGKLNMTRCTFTDNWVKPASATDSGISGALWLEVSDSVATLNSCQFHNNRAATSAGALYSRTNKAGKLQLYDCWFESNTVIHDQEYVSDTGVDVQLETFVGGAWFSEGPAICSTGSCAIQEVTAHDTTFLSNSALEGAAVYLYGAVRHHFFNCTWRANFGLVLIQASYLGDESDQILLQSLGPVMYFGSLAMNVSFQDCHMVDNWSNQSTVIALRQTNFRGSLTFSNCVIIDNSTIGNSFFFKNIPKFEINFDRTYFTGKLIVHNDALVHGLASTFTGNITLKDGGAFEMTQMVPIGLEVTVGSQLQCGQAEPIVNGGSLDICVDTVNTSVSQNYDSYSLFTSDKAGHKANQVVEHNFIEFYMNSTAIPTELPPGGIIDDETYLSTVHIEYTQETILPVGLLPCIAGADDDDYTLECMNTDSAIASWVFWLLLGLSIAFVTAVVAYLSVLWHRWAIPAEGVLGILKCCPTLITRCASCVCPCLCRDILTEPVAPEKLYPELYMSCEGEDQLLEAENSLSSPRKVTEEDEQSSIDAGVAHFGYGLIDYTSDLCIRHVIGKALMAARYVAVKEVENGTDSDVLREANLMQDIPFHCNVIYLYGMTDKPLCLVSGYISGACELQDYLQQNRRSREAYVQETLLLLLDVATGMSHLHKHRIVHCDLAPRNVFVDTSHDTTNYKDSQDPLSQHRNRALVGDFGLARKMDDQQRHLFSGTYERYLGAPENFGTIEAFEGLHGPEADVFMFSALIWEVLTRTWHDFKGWFQEGQGLTGWKTREEYRQATIKGNKRLGTDSKRGVLLLLEAIANKCPKLPNVDLVAHMLCQMVAQGLQKDLKQRPTMREVQIQLKAVWDLATGGTNQEEVHVTANPVQEGKFGHFDESRASIELQSPTTAEATTVEADHVIDMS